MKEDIDINEKNANKLRDNTIDLERQNNGSIKTNSVKNVALILTYDRNIKDMFRFNEFTQEVDVVKNESFKIKRIGQIVISKGQYTDQVTNSIELYIESQPAYDNANLKMPSLNKQSTMWRTCILTIH